MGDETSSLISRLRPAFLAGLLVTVPLAVTLWVLWTLAAIIDSLPLIIFEETVPGVGIVLTLTLVLLVGYTVRNQAGRQIVSFYESLLQRVPVASSVYNGVKQVVEAAVSRGADSVEAVVLVQWPRPGIWSIAFRTGRAWAQPEEGPRMVSVFLPSTPNPTTGFYFILPENEVVETDLTVEDAAKVLMSAGIVSPDWVTALPAPRPRLEETPDPL